MEKKGKKEKQKSKKIMNEKNYNLIIIETFSLIRNNIIIL